ncbi:MAG TPA: hypothetical protein VD884_16955 [Ohtaekwangia sp.]|nr:hypothetical protein [Ohtaekwangia sp.]
MNKVYYRGMAYDYEIAELAGNRVFALYKDGQLLRFVKDEDLDIRSRVSWILDAYYNTSKSSLQSEVLN